MASREPKIVKLGEDTYIIGYWDIDKSLEVWAWLLKNFSEGVTSAVTSYAVENDKDDEEKIKSIVRSMTTQLSPKEYTRYAKWIVEGIKVNGGDLKFNDHFMGGVGRLHVLLVHILTFQYSDFLEGSVVEDIVAALATLNPTNQGS